MNSNEHWEEFKRTGKIRDYLMARMTDESDDEDGEEL